ncbi:MAG: HlyC/CorC family transporter [Candidatus Hydrogenedentes bacterium]|nr:HlyC/CorC family transporter [Candidatus Hydrogenedentota bacterium]
MYLDGDGSDLRYRSLWKVGISACWIALTLALVSTFSASGSGSSDAAASSGVFSFGGNALPTEHFTAVFVLLAFSAFFSASEVAFFSLHKLELRSLRESTRPLDRLAARLMESPGNLLTAILMGNSIANVLLSVVLAAPVEHLFARALPAVLPADWPVSIAATLAYLLAVACCTFLLVFFGEITPKLLVVRNSTGFVRAAAVPLYLAYGLLSPLRAVLMSFTGLLFRVTRFSEMKPAPFMTDDEFKSLLSEGEATGAIEKEEREMIQGILEFSDVSLREILIPRPDIIALPAEATVREALLTFREHEYARMPVYREDLDHITGILFAKDLLRVVERGDLDTSIQPLLRKVHYVPEIMTVSEFIKLAQQLRTHMTIVVDEFGGTEGLVTLQDAIREVVGDIGEEDDDEQPLWEEVRPGVYLADGSLSLYELEKNLGISVDEGEHTTIAGFLMEQTDKVLEVGDELEHDSVRFKVEAMEGRRVSRLRIQVKPPVANEVPS